MEGTSQFRNSRIPEIWIWKSINWTENSNRCWWIPSWNQRKSATVSDKVQMGPHFSHLNWKRTEGRAHDPHPNIATAIYNVIWTSISGEKFSWDDPFLRKLVDNLETNLQAVELTGPHNYVTILRYILPYNVDIWQHPFSWKWKPWLTLKRLLM